MIQRDVLFLSEELPDIDSFNDIHPHFNDDPLSGSTTYSANSLLEEFADELALISYPLDYDDNRDGDSQREDIDIVTKTDDVLTSSVENDDDLFNDPLLEEVDLFLFDNSIQPGIETIADDPEGDIRFLEEFLIDDSILSHESFDSNFEDNPSIP
nr:hypothetical protein [Tanacetum cinerariifolium]